MKKAFISVAFIFSFLSYVLYNNFSAQAASSVGTTQTTPTTTTVPPITAIPVTTPSPVATTPTPTPTPIPTPTPVPVPVKKGQYTDGSYTGAVADAYYGNVQVRATISGGKLTNVTFLQYPNDRSTSRYISAQAMPLLTSEAIQAQSANVDGVSGASHTSEAFVQSLSDALTQAKA